jgi:hypothetical protein
MTESKESQMKRLIWLAIGGFLLRKLRERSRVGARVPR